jgi:hypothetical protein
MVFSHSPAIDTDKLMTAIADRKVGAVHRIDSIGPMVDRHTCPGPCIAIDLFDDAADDDCTAVRAACAESGLVFKGCVDGTFVMCADDPRLAKLVKGSAP